MLTLEQLLQKYDAILSGEYVGISPLLRNKAIRLEEALRFEILQLEGIRFAEITSNEMVFTHPDVEKPFAVFLYKKKGSDIDRKIVEVYNRLRFSQVPWIFAPGGYAPILDPIIGYAGPPEDNLKLRLYRRIIARLMPPSIYNELLKAVMQYESTS